IWDGLRTQRLDRPYVRKNGKLTAVNWAEAFDTIAEKVNGTVPENIGAIAGDLSSVEEIYAMRELMAAIGSPNVDCRPENSALDPTLGRSSYIFNSTIQGIEDASSILLVGVNPRKEAAVLNSRIRKRWRIGQLPLGLIGEEVDLTYDYRYLGAGPDTLEEVASAEGPPGDRKMLIVGEGAINRPDGAAVLAAAARMALENGLINEEWCGFNILHTAAARVGGLDLGFVPGEGGKATEGMLRESEVLFILGADELDMTQRTSGFTVYVGSHGDIGAHHADVILPGAAYTEKSGTWVNTEGRVQMGMRATFPPGEAREDWAILRALSESLGHTLPFDSLAQLRKRLYEVHPHFEMIDTIPEMDPAGDETGATGIEKLAGRKGGRMTKQPFVSPVDDFYLTNPIARASAVMAECSTRAKGEFLEAAE
ncbi:MAG: molybdopterin-dependent oxidoreductase, partial [Rhizobiaceae bacterium]